MQVINTPAEINNKGNKQLMRLIEVLITPGAFKSVSTHLERALNIGKHTWREH